MTNLRGAGLSLGLVFVSQLAFAGAYDDLTQDQKNTVQNGGQVAVYTDVSGSAWPKVNVYQRVDATPEEAEAVFADYALQTSYIPNIKKSDVSSRVDRATVHVDYRLETSLPLGLGTIVENYTVEDHLVAYNGTDYRMEWKLVRADTTKSTEGYARFEKLGTGTLVAYYSFIVPGRGGASLGPVVSGAKKAVRDSVTALIGQIGKERSANRALLDQQLNSLHNAVGK